MSKVIPDYYRNEFKGPFAKIYDPFVKIVSLGAENRLRDKAFAFFPQKPKTILDLCCGTGSLTIREKLKFSKAKVYGVDLSEEMLNIAERKAKKASIKIEFIISNIEKLKFQNNFFDVVTISLGMHEVPKSVRIKVVQEAYRVLKPQGKFIIIDFNKPHSRFFQKLLLRFFRMAEPYGKSFIDTDFFKLLPKFKFKNIEQKIFYQFVQIISGQKI